MRRRIPLVLCLALSGVVAWSCDEKKPPPQGKELQPVKPPERKKKTKEGLSLAPAQAPAPAHAVDAAPFGVAMLPALPAQGVGQMVLHQVPGLGTTTAVIAYSNVQRSPTGLNATVSVTAGPVTLLAGSLSCTPAGCTVTDGSSAVHAPGALALDADGGGQLSTDVTNAAGQVIGAYVIGFNSDGDFNVFTQFTDGSPADLVGTGSLTPQ
ncbi:MAG: hypothetical protein JNK82_41590 [Myxococcaceae bacterium]|nr:hypothetical protein [Myxococcaceae bacterium]